MAAPASAVTISRAAEILGEDEQLLWDLADDMDPEDGRLWIYGTDDQQTIAFTPAGVEYLRELLAEHNRFHETSTHGTGDLFLDSSFASSKRGVASWRDGGTRSSWR